MEEQTRLARIRLEEEEARRLEAERARKQSAEEEEERKRLDAEAQERASSTRGRGTSRLGLGSTRGSVRGRVGVAGSTRGRGEPALGRSRAKRLARAHLSGHYITTSIQLSAGLVQIQQVLEVVAQAQQVEFGNHRQLLPGATCNMNNCKSFVIDCSNNSNIMVAFTRLLLPPLEPRSGHVSTRMQQLGRSFLDYIDVPFEAVPTSP